MSTPPIALDGSGIGWPSLRSPLHVQFDGFADAPFNFSDDGIGHDAAGQVRHVGGVVGLGFLDHDDVVHGAIS